MFSTEDRLSGMRGRGPSLTWQVRLVLIVVAGLLLAVFATALWLDPYYADGTARPDETHRQLGLPECTFKTLTGKPCPSCGMTTSFSLLTHLDPINSLRANAVGTLLAGFLLMVLPWSIVCLVRGRLYFIKSLERALTWTVAVFLILLLVRWAIVLTLFKS
jgi:hypothetical protein